MTTDQRRSGEVCGPGGRVLRYAEWGEPAGPPVFVLHGTPGCRLSRYPDEEVIRSVGARLITYDRPGYGEIGRASCRERVSPRV